MPVELNSSTVGAAVLKGGNYSAFSQIPSAANFALFTETHRAQRSKERSTTYGVSSTSAEEHTKKEKVVEEKNASRV